MVSTPVRGVRLAWQLVLAGTGLGVLLAVLCAAGLTLFGLVVGALHAVCLPLLVFSAARHHGRSALGPADLVTTCRAMLVGGCAALVADGLATRADLLVALVGVASVALLLDAVDGRVARATGTATAFGARFDMEVDAYLLLVLSVPAATLLGSWVLAIGALRYVFVAAGWVWPWLRGELPPRRSAKVVAAVQGIVLVVVAARVLPAPLPEWITVLALAALVWSFACSVRWLWQHRSGEALF